MTIYEISRKLGWRAIARQFFALFATSLASFAVKGFDRKARKVDAKCAKPRPPDMKLHH